LLLFDKGWWVCCGVVEAGSIKTTEHISKFEEKIN